MRTEEEKDHQEKKFSEVAVARPPKMRKLSWKACLCCIKNHLTSLGRSLGLSETVRVLLMGGYQS